MKEENMTAQKLITVGENENTVFRSCKDGIHTNVFETICAFLNTRGGTLLLGVDESGEVYGFKERAIPDIIQALKMATQNADTFQPPFEMEPVREIVDGKYVLVLKVPESANVHALRGKVFVRSGAGIVADSVPERDPSRFAGEEWRRYGCYPCGTKRRADKTLCAETGDLHRTQNLSVYAGKRSFRQSDREGKSTAADEKRRASVWQAGKSCPFKRNESFRYQL